MPTLCILGPLKAEGADGDLTLGGGKPRRLLAALALHPGEVISADRLIDLVWGDSPPRSAQENLLTYLWSLRRSLKAAGCAGIEIKAQPPGYALYAAPGELDSELFTSLAAAASRCLSSDPATAAQLLREALGLWRGPALDDVADGLPLLRGRIAALDEARLTALEQRIQADLAVGRSADLIAEITGLVAAHPLREQFRAHQMTALYRSGRQAEALAAFHSLRKLLAEELGVDPSPEIRRLQAAILRGDPSLDAPPSAQAAPPATAAFVPAVPRQLPAPAAGFVGRSRQLRRLGVLAAFPGGDMRIVAITGTPGVGKTALAVRWAHDIQDRFPGGTLFADLRGYGPAGVPAESGDILDGFLRALGVPPDGIPAAREARTALLRSTLDGKHALILLDNAVSPAQVRPLLPGSAGCLVIVTSRSTLSGLVARDGAARLALEPLAEDESVALLRETLGARRVDADPVAGIEVARLCDGLPLALRIAAERAALSTALPLSDLAAHLADEQDRLRVLATDDQDTAVGAAFWWSYRRLPADAARAFRLLGLHPGRECSLPAASALTAMTMPAARQTLGTLTGMGLLEEPRQDHFRLHDLLAAYAAQRAAQDEPRTAGAAAVRRVLTWYLYTADAADRILIPRRSRHELGEPPAGCQPKTFTADADALGWCESERVNLVAATRQALMVGELELAWTLPAALSSYFLISRQWGDWVATHRAGIEATRQLGDRGAEARLLGSLGSAYGDLRQFEDAADCLNRALVIHTERANRNGQGGTLINLGFLNWKRLRFDAGISCFRQALAIFRDLGDPYGEGMALNNLGEACRERGRDEEGIGYLREALGIFRAAADKYNEAMALDSLSNAYCSVRDFDEALRLVRQSLAIRREVGDRHGEAISLVSLATTLDARDDTKAGSRAWRQALAIFESLGDPQAAEIRARLATRTVGAA